MADSYRELAREIVDLRRRVNARAPRLIHSTIEGGALTLRDGNQPTGYVGLQVDGTYGSVTVSGPVPPTPAGLTVTAVVGGVLVRWGGEWVQTALDVLANRPTVAPLDFVRVEVHVSDTAVGFTAVDFSTMRGTISSPRGGDIFVPWGPAGTPLYARLVARSASGKASEASALVGPTPSGAVGLGDLGFNVADYTPGATVTSGPDEPVDPGIGDLWLAEIAAGPPVQHETRRWNGAIWQVVLIQTITNALELTLAAQQAADEKAQFFPQAAEPTGLGPEDKAIWVDTDDGNRMRSWSGTAWVDRRLGNSAIQPNSLVASDVIATGTVSAALLEAILVLTTSVIAGDPDGTHVRLTPTGLRAYRLDPGDLSVDEYFRVGTDTDDTLALIDAAGVIVAGIDTTGVGSFSGLNVTSDPRIQGTLLSQMFGEKAEVAAWTFDWPNPGQTTGELGMVELAITTKPGHAYAIWANGLIPDVSGVDVTAVAFKMRATLDGSAPTINSPIIAAENVVTRWDAYPWENPAAQIFALRHETSPTPRTMRIGLTISKGISATDTQLFVDNNNFHRYFMILDLGMAPSDSGQVNYMGGSRVTTPPPAPPTAAKVQGETIFNANWVSNFRGNGSYIDFAEAYQGYETTNGNMRSFIGFPDMTGALAGAAIRYVKVWLWYGHWWNNSGGYPIVHWHNNLNKVTTAVNQDAEFVTGPLVGRGAGLWLTLPVVWGDRFRDGTARGVALGPGPDTNRVYYGRANGPGQAYAPKIAVGWTK